MINVWRVIPPHNTMRKDYRMHDWSTMMKNIEELPEDKKYILGKLAHELRMDMHRSPKHRKAHFGTQWFAIEMLYRLFKDFLEEHGENTITLTFQEKGVVFAKANPAKSLPINDSVEDMVKQFDTSWDVFHSIYSST